MWLVSMAGLLGIALSASGFEDPIPENTGVQPPPIASRQTLFSIPFHVDRPRSSNSVVAEVQLFFSTDTGRQWQHYGSVHPGKGHFLFRATRDGQYDFAIRTLDRSGQLFPTVVDRSSLTVVVDTEPPKLQVEAVRGAGDLVTAKWRINDANLDINSLVLQFRADGRPWQTVTLDRTGITAKSTSWVNETTWRWGDPANPVEIRAEVSDIAGNRSVCHARTKPPAFSTGVVPDAGLVERPKQQSWYPKTGSQSQDWQAVRSPESARDNARSWQRPTGFDVQPEPRIGQQVVRPIESSSAARNGTLPPGVRPRAVNSRRFDIEYQVSSGTNRVDLWGTQDGGHTWSYWGVDHNNQSPMMATVKADGLYGFLIRATNGQSRTEQPPPSGTTPNAWVIVDTKRPNVRILGVGKKAGPTNGPLVIRWEATDAMQPPKSVAIFYREATEGQWFPIIMATPNTGEYAWTTPSKLPERIHLRIEVRDQSGNVGLAESLESIFMEKWKPNAQIGDIQPITQTIQPKRYYFR